MTSRSFVQSPQLASRRHLVEWSTEVRNFLEGTITHVPHSYKVVRISEKITLAGGGKAESGDRNRSPRDQDHRPLHGWARYSGKES